MKPQLILALVVVAIVAGGIGYSAGSLAAPPPKTVTQTVTTTVGGATVTLTTTVTQPPRTVTTTVTAPPTTVTVTKPPEKIKVAFVYVGPIGDYGWTHAHDVGRRYIESQFKDRVETYYVESVEEPKVYDVLKKLVNEGYKVIFTTSFGFMDGTLQAAKEFPNVIFFHCSGYERWSNLGTYFADLYQLYYLNGLMAGALTKSGKVGYVAAHPIPEVVRHIDAFALGVKEVNPKAKVHVVWIHAWYDPAKARAAAESLIAQGVDVLAFTEDSPAVIEVAQEYYKRGTPVYAFAHYSPMLKFGPDVVVSGQLVRWESIYVDIISKIITGVYNTTNLRNVDYWWLLSENAVELGGDFGVPINPKFITPLKNFKVKEKISGTEISVYDLVMMRLKQMSEPRPSFDPFCAVNEPIISQDGKVLVRPGECLGHEALWSIMSFVDNVVGSIPAGSS
ncbi:MAG: BMP family ABC transporter substrate-binding protein [Sulfolobales archaeon]|nr:BMP family ABC transporter substrate-binding protein [Sulfolobales archaeon]